MSCKDYLRNALKLSRYREHCFFATQLYSIVSWLCYHHSCFYFYKEKLSKII